ncbi:NAD(P)/FAD-dependent oxidoreductase [Pseudomonas syringae group genomosp. 3]|nr:FAD-dependent oxidoreductase [Pseudomonas syringae group genomosp. 3]RMR05944.1 Initial dioxygenase reductase subunit [Pseudomonas syringae pv. primulae]
MNKPIVIIGANAAGVSAALTLRQHGFDGSISLLSSEKQLPYERPAVSKEILLNGKAPLILPEEEYQNNNIDLLLGSTAVDIDVSASSVVLDSGKELKAQKILIATGGRVRKLQIPGADKKGILYARSFEDSMAISDTLFTGTKLIVIGGGLIGAEIAACAIHQGCEVTWVEAEPACLNRALGTPLAEVMMGIHRAKGVVIETNASVTKILGEAKASGIELSDGRKLYADALVVGIGITPVDELAAKAGIRLENGIAVDRRCETSIPNIFAAGDVAFHKTSHMVKPGRLEHWHNAQKQGAVAAQAMLGLPADYDELPWFWTDQYVHHIEGCGLAHMTDELIERSSDCGERKTYFYLRNDRLVATTSLNRPNDVRASMRLIAKGYTPDRRLLSDPTVDLRKLEKELKNAIS